MTAPANPEEKKEVKQEEKILTTEERITYLENAVNNAFNYLAQGIHEVDFKAQNQNKELQVEISKTLTLMNMSNLQNIIMMRELVKMLGEKEIIDLKAFEEIVTAELTKAVEAQQKILFAEQEKAEADSEEVQADSLAVDPTL